MGRLDYGTPTPGKDELEEGVGDCSTYFLKNHSTRDESSLTPLVSTNTESLSARLRRRLGSKAVCTGTFFSKRAAEELFGKVSIKMFNILQKALTMDL